MAWCVSILIHATIVIIVLSNAGIFNFAENKKIEFLSVSIEGDPNKSIGGHKSLNRFAAITQGIEVGTGKGGLTTTSQETSGKGGGTGFNVKENYIGSILKKIHSAKYYPIYAKKTGLKGVVKLEFTLRKDGTIRGVITKVKSSGVKILDDAGIKTITDAAPFASFPQEIKDDEINFLIDIDFVL